MSYDPRTIAFLAEIIHPPISPLEAQAVQRIHNALFQQPEISYQSFQVNHDGIHLTNLPPTPGAVSSVTFTPDRLVFREELQGTTPEDFATRLVNVSKIAFAELGIENSLAQQFVIRSLVNPRQVKDSREFLAHHVLGGGPERFAPFGRPLQTIGLSFQFPQSEESQETFHVRIESWNDDPRSVWIENVGSFTAPIAADSTPELSDRLYSTYRFATGPAMDYLGQFDQAGGVQ